MFKLVTKGKSWKAVFAALGPLAEEAVFKISPAGIESFSMAPSHTEAIGFFFPKESFSEYSIDGEETISINVPVPTMFSIFKRFANDSDVSLTSTTKGSMIVSNGVKNFDCSLIVVDEMHADKPKIPYEQSFEIELSKLEEMMDDCKVFGIDILYFESKNNDLIYSGHDSSGRVDGVMIEHYPQETTKIGFNFTFMEPVLKSIKAYSDSKLKIELYPNAPIRMTFEIVDVLDIQYYLAPLSQ